MKSRIATGLVIVSFLATAPIALHAQLRGMLKKKADEVLKGKPAAPAAPESGKDAPAPPPTPTAAASPATKPADVVTAKAEPKAPADPLDVTQLNLQSTANQTLRGEMEISKGDWEQLPYINQKTVAAAKALDEPTRVAFVEKVGAAFKSLVMSDAFQASHAAYIKQEYKAEDHGIAGLVSAEELGKKGNYTAMNAVFSREQSATIVEVIEAMQPDQVQTMLADDLKGWERRAAEPTRKDRAKYQKFAKDGQALQALGTSDPAKLRRGYAVLRSADNDGPDTEAALYAVAARVKQEKEQIAWDQHNLKGVLKRQLAAFVAVVPTVDFAAATAQKSGKTVFVKPAYEQKGQVWKACFRAGKAPTMAALAVAQAWLKEL